MHACAHLKHVSVNKDPLAFYSALSQAMKRIAWACVKYSEWKQKHNPDFKPWLYPEQSRLSSMALSELSVQRADSLENIDESALCESKDECAEQSDDDWAHTHTRCIEDTKHDT